MIWIEQHRPYAVSSKGEVRLARGEYLLALYLKARPGWVRTKEQLLDAMERDLDVSEQAVPAAVKRLRAKLRQIGDDPIQTYRGLGYSWTDESPSA